MLEINLFQTQNSPVAAREGQVYVSSAVILLHTNIGATGLKQCLCLGQRNTHLSVLPLMAS